MLVDPTFPEEKLRGKKLNLTCERNAIFMLLSYKCILGPTKDMDFGKKKLCIQLYSPKNLYED